MTQKRRIFTSDESKARNQHSPKNSSSPTRTVFNHTISDELCLHKINNSLTNSLERNFFEIHRYLEQLKITFPQITKVMEKDILRIMHEVGQHKLTLGRNNQTFLYASLHVVMRLHGHAFSL